jgi:hypothetical protein
MSKQTAVEWLIKEIQRIPLEHRMEKSHLYMHALQMEREQMIDFAQMWQDSPIEKYDCKEDLYNETYKGGEQ